jgi:hypothetical protein
VAGESACPTLAGRNIHCLEIKGRIEYFLFLFRGQLALFRTDGKGRRKRLPYVGWAEYSSI